MTICTHNFIKSAEVSKPVAGNLRGTAGVETICVKCGQVRRAFVDGVVTITHEGRGPLEEDVASQ